MEEPRELGCVGRLEFITRQEDWVSSEWESLNREFFSVVIDDLLDFLEEYYLPL